MQLYTRFMEEQKALGGKVICLSSEDTLGAHMYQLAQNHHWQRIILDPALPSPYYEHLQQTLSPLLLHVETSRSLVSLVNEADAGITFTPWGIAETGTVVEVATSDLTRYISTLPPVHIALLPAQGLVATPAELAPHLRKAVTESSYATITFISGPSRTADIEMQLILGVHGPRNTYTLIIP